MQAGCSGSVGMKSSIKGRRIARTEPIPYPSEEEDEAVLKAKNYLINLNMDEDQQYVSFKHTSKHRNVDSLLAEWNSQHNHNIRMTQRLINLENEARQSRLAASFEQQNQLSLSLVEKELISKQSPKSSMTRQKTNATSTKNRILKQISHQTTSKPQKNPMLLLSLPKPSLKSIYVKKIKLGQKQFPTKVDIASLNELKSSQNMASYRFRDKQFSEKLPRLDNMQAEMFKNKYNSVFRNIDLRFQKFSISPNSLLSKQIIKINDLIKEQNVKFTNNL